MLATIQNHQSHQSDNDFVASFQAARISLVIELRKISNLIQAGDAPNQQLKERFCEALVDYVAMGHFGLYERIYRHGDSAENNLGLLAREYYALMLRGTRLALLFNDHHSVDCKDDIKASRFILEFSELGMMLAQRFEAEDHLLKI